MTTQQLYDRIMALRQDTSLSGLTREPLKVNEYGTSGDTIIIQGKIIESIELPELINEFRLSFIDFERKGLVLGD